MDTKPTKEQMEDFKNHIGWRYIEEWIHERLEDCKNRLLSSKNMEEVIKIQNEHSTYKNVISKVSNYSVKGQ